MSEARARYNEAYRQLRENDFAWSLVKDGSPEDKAITSLLSRCHRVEGWRNRLRQVDFIAGLRVRRLRF